MPPPKLSVQAQIMQRLHYLLDPSRVYYRPVVFDMLQRGDIAELKALVVGAKELKAEYGDFDGLIKAAELAAKKVAAK